MINKILSKLSGLSTQRTFLFFLLVTGFYYFFGDYGKSLQQIEGQVHSVQLELDKERVRLKETERIMKKAEVLKTSVESLRERFKISSKQLPAKNTSTDVMRIVDSMARTAGVFVREKEPGLAVHLGILKEYPVKVNIRGNFSDLILFLYYISNLEKVNRVNHFTINKDEGEAGQIKAGQVKMEATISGYEYIGGEMKL